MAGEYEPYDVMMAAHKMESMRGKVKLEKAMTTFFVILLVSSVFWAPMLASALQIPVDGIGVPIMFLPVVFIIALFFFAGSKEAEFTRIFKTEFVPRVLNTMFDNVTYKADGGFKQKHIQVMNVMRTGNRYNTEDYISADYNGVHFQRADVYSAQHTSTGKSSHTTVYFEGRVYQVMFNKMLAGGVQIRSKDFTFYDMPDYLDNKDKVKMENETFNSRFDVFASTQQDAFYVLTPQFMEKLLYIEKKFTSVNIMIVGNRLIIAGKSRLNGLEPQLKYKIEYDTECARIKEELREVTDIIDVLNLNNRTFIYNV